MLSTPVTPLTVPLKALPNRLTQSVTISVYTWVANYNRALVSEMASAIPGEVLEIANINSTSTNTRVETLDLAVSRGYIIYLGQPQSIVRRSIKTSLQQTEKRLVHSQHQNIKMKPGIHIESTWRSLNYKLLAGARSKRASKLYSSSFIYLMAAKLLLILKVGQLWG